MRITLVILVVAGACGVWVGWWVYQKNEADRFAGGPEETATTSSDAATATIPTLPELTRKEVKFSGPATSPSIGTAITEVPELPWPDSEFTPEEYEQFKIPIFRAVQAKSRNWTVETFGRYERNRNQITGRDSYTVYAYLRSCLGIPRSTDALADKEEEIRNSRRIRRRGGEEAVAASIDDARAGMVRCEGLPDDRELITEMVDWLTQAAVRGFPQAQHAYHHSVPWLLGLNKWGPYRHPDRVYEYRRMAPIFLEAALTSGHPDAFAEFSAALREGIIFDADDQAAYGYAYAADLASHGTHEEAIRYMGYLQHSLTPDQVREAKRMGRNLCDSFCRNP